MATRPLRRRALAFSLSLIVCAIVGYLASIAIRTAPVYSEQKEGHGWRGRVFEADPELGFRLVPGARGAERFPIGEDVPVRIDTDGFRIPSDAEATSAVEPSATEAHASAGSPVRSEQSPTGSAAARPRPLVLALGCSFTYGAGCKAEDTFPYLVADQLGGSCVNAGCPSYGLAQMLILARRLIPLLRPDYVLFQHSPWLAERSRTRFAPAMLGALAVPHFEAGGTGSEGANLLPPAFRPVAFDLPVERFLDSQRGLLDFLSFQVRVGIPLLVHDDTEKLLLRFREGALRPAEGEAIASAVHAEVAKLCAENDARMVLVIVGKSCLPAVPVEPSVGELRCIQVDARALLCEGLPETDKDPYLARYGRWEGDPPVLVDAHPNRLAHSIIARAIAAGIEAAR